MKRIGAYIYGIVPCDKTVILGGMGLQGKEVLTLPAGRLSAAVHWCDPMSYRGDDPKGIRKWVVAHQEVVDHLWRRFGSILPMHFGVIVTGDDRRDVIRNVLHWIGEREAQFLDVSERLRGRAEYGVQVFWEEDSLKEAVLIDDPEMIDKKRGIDGMSPGIAYLKGKGLESELKDKVALRIERESERIVADVRDEVADVSIEPCKVTQDGRIMIVNLSCLADDKQAGRLGNLLEEMDKRSGFSVRFTGPWPPYSFVNVEGDCGQLTMDH